MKKRSKDLTKDELKRIEQELDDAYDFDPKDPLFGLSQAELSGPKLSRRSVLRLMAAAGMLSASQFIPGLGGRRAFAQGASGGELTAGWNANEILTLDPAQINQVLQFQVASNILSGLTHINPDLVAEGDLARDWSVSADGLEWTFNLREGVLFHNGDVFTADDVLFTYNRSLDPEQSINSGLLANIDSVEKIDDLTVRFKLNGPQASFLVKTLERASGRAMTIVNRRALEEMGPAQYGLTPVGTGPFRITSHQLGQGVVLERFENYFDPERPKLDKVTIIPISEPEPLAAALEAGDVQLLGGNAVPSELVDRFLANPDLVVDEKPDPGFQSLFINPWRDPFKVTDFDKPFDELAQEDGFKVRLAIAKAIDRDDWVKRALFGRGLPAFGTINPAMGFFFDTGINETSQQRFDVPEAQRLLAEAGFPNGEGFPTLSLMVTPAERRGGQILADILKRNLNIDVELDVQDFTVLVENFQTMNYDLLRIGSGGDFDPDDGLVDWMQTGSRLNGPNRNVDEMPFGFFSAAEVDELVDRQRVEADLDARKALVQQANAITSDKVASAFLHHGTEILVYRKEVNYPAESRITGLRDLDRVTVS
ncbi:MAG: ABC transporter substrate-binding protein [Trueperaceae bacterium]|nr:MAG: ABC transporter substrate-binding protein [Trueperaceae bacterium]